MTGTPKKRRDWRPAWLAAFEAEGTVSAACARANVGRTTVYRTRQADEDFALAWADIEEQTTERMEREAYRRGVEGVPRDIYHQGQVVGAERQFSDVLLIFMLKSRRPERYRDNVKVEHAGEVKQTHGVDLAKLSPTEKRALLELVEKAVADAPSDD